MAAFLAAVKAKKAEGSSSNASQAIHTISSVVTHKSANVKGPGCPFNLDDIFASEFENQGKLRDFLKFLLESIESTGVTMHQLETRLVSKFMAIDQ